TRTIPTRRCRRTWIRRACSWSRGSGRDEVPPAPARLLSGGGMGLAHALLRVAAAHARRSRDRALRALPRPHAPASARGAARHLRARRRAALAPVLLV